MSAKTRKTIKFGSNTYMVQICPRCGRETIFLTSDITEDDSCPMCCKGFKSLQELNEIRKIEAGAK